MADCQRTCRECGNQFKYEIGRGKDRDICGDRCRRAIAAKHAASSHALRPKCSVDGCSLNTRSSGSVYCETHYYRIRRNGTLIPKAVISPPQKESAHSNGYVLEYCPGHFEAVRTGSNRVYQHRRVFYDNHGSGPFDCHWCAEGVTWDTMHVDHVNAQPSDNSPSNLVASCATCNQKRGHAKAKVTSRLRSANQITWMGKTRCIADWADDLGISRESLKWRIKAGWPIGKAMTEPRGRTGPIART